MKKIGNSKLLLKILSGVIAVVLWFAITYTEDPAISQTLTGVNIDIKGEEALNSNGFAVVNKEDLPTISVVIRGSRSNVISALGEISATVDVSQIKRTGKNALSVSYSYPTGKVVLEKVREKDVSVEIEALVSREIPVKVEVVNREKNSNFIIKSSSKTDTITVSGAESTIYEIAYAKVRQDASKISKTSVQECIYSFFDDKDELVSEQNIVKKDRETVAVESTVYERVSLPIKPVLDEESRADYGIKVKNMEKNTVEAGLDSGVNVEYIEAVVTPQKDKTEYEATLIVPEGVYIDENNLKVKVAGEILPKELKEISVKVEAVNVPEGRNFTVIPSEKVIAVKTIEEITDMKATVDIGKMTMSEEILTLKIETEADADIIGTYSVVVKQEAGE